MSAASAQPRDTRIAAMRAFNRFYTRQIGLLQEGLLHSAFSLTQSRVLYELARRDGPAASELARDLSLDPGYLSRLLKGFERRDLITRKISSADARQSTLHLTEAGHAAFAELDAAARGQMAALLAPLEDAQQAELIEAVATVQRLLGDASQPQVPYILRAHQPGDIGSIIRGHALLYHQEYGWDGTFEAFVAEIAAAFVNNFDARWERCWIAEREGAVVGSVFLVRQSDEECKLRMLYVDRAARGLGIGSRLVDECIRFARGVGYRRMSLWTNDILVSARRIYEAAGFRLVAEERHHSFGKDLVGQNWELTL